MTTYTKLAYIKRYLCLGFIILFWMSCTHDYFEDETNFRLYIPQVKNNEIKNFYVAFHDAGGNHVRTRSIESPFNKDSFMEEGILRFKLYPGEYSITCFADYAPGSLTEGEPLASSYKSYDPHSPESDLYTSRTEKNTTNPRILFFHCPVYPIGHPVCKTPIEANINDTCRYKGEVITKFTDLPAIVTRIDILYSGLATKVGFDGMFDCFTPQDRIIASFNIAGPIDDDAVKSVTFTDRINPSAGVTFNDYLLGRFAATAQPLGLEVRFYDGNGARIGTTLFGSEDLTALPPDKRPTDKQGNPVSNLILVPRTGIIFTFKGFTVFQIELTGWGDITEGEITPM